jgi:hypothetical protein
MKREKLELVAKLAKHGVDGERQAAIAILASFGINPDDIEDNEKQVEVFLNYKNAFEKQLIVQVYCRIMKTNELYFYFIGKHKVSIRLPKSKSDRLINNVDSVISLWRKQLKTFQSAFINTNRLYSGIDDDKPSSLTQDEIDEIVSMARNLKTITLDNLLEQNNE